MHHERDRGDHYQHKRRDGIEEESEFDHQAGSKLQPGAVEYDSLQTFAVFGYELRRAAKEISQCRDIAQHQHGAHSCRAERAGKPMGHFHAGQSQQKEHEERYGQNKYRYRNVHDAEWVNVSFC